MRAEGQGEYDATVTTAISSVLASYKCRASAIVVLTTSGKTAHIVAKYRPLCPILAVTRFDQVARKMQLYRGCLPLLYEESRNEDWSADVDESGDGKNGAERSVLGHDVGGLTGGGQH